MVYSTYDSVGSDNTTKSNNKAVVKKQKSSSVEIRNFCTANNNCCSVNRSRPSLHQRKTKTKTVDAAEKKRTRKLTAASESKTKSKINSIPMEESETIRKWFLDLPSGATRSAVASINDDNFIKHYLELCKQYQLSLSYHHWSSEKGDAVINAILNGRDAEFYEDTREEVTPRSPLKIPEVTLSKDDHTITYEALPLTDTEHYEQMMSSNSCEVSKARERDSSSRILEIDTVTTLHFSSGKNLKISASMNGETLRAPEQAAKALKNNGVERTYKSTEYKIKDFETTFMISDSMYKIPEATNKTKRDIAVAKKQASLALISRACAKHLCGTGSHNEMMNNKPTEDESFKNKQMLVQRDNEHVNPWVAMQSLDLIHCQIRLVSTVMAENVETMFKTIDKNGASDDMTLDMLCFDPEFLSDENGKKLCVLADSIIKQYHSPESYQGFLRTYPSEKNFKLIVKGEMWPSWVYRCTRGNINHHNDTCISIPFHVLFLAKIEVAILRSYHRHLNETASLRKSQIIEDVTNVRSVSKESNGENLSGIDMKQKTKSELSTVFRLAKKLRQNGEKLGRDRCMSLFQSLVSSEDGSSNGDVNDDGVKTKQKNALSLENLLLIPFPFLQSVLLGKKWSNMNVSFTGAIKSTVQQLYSIAVEANAILTREFLSSAESKTTSTNGQNSNKPCSRNRRKNKKKKKKKKNSQPKAFEPPDKPRPEQSSIHTKTPLNIDAKPNDSNNTAQNILEKSPSTESGLDDSCEVDSKSKTSVTSCKSNLVDVTVLNGSSAVVVEQINSSATETHNDESWSKVESKSRGNRVRTSQKITLDNATNLPGTETKSGKTKVGRTSASRKRVANRKIAKEILAFILEGVDNEINRRRKTEQRAHHEERKRKDQDRKAATKAKSIERPSSLRDVVVGNGVAFSNKTSIEYKKTDKNQQESRIATTQSSCILNRVFGTNENGVESQCTKLPKSSRRQHKNHNADQNTAPTLPETLSGVSAMSTSNNSAGSVEYHQQETISNDSSDVQAVKADSVSPPLPTLLSGLRQTNSASSSVASSLEAHGSGEQNLNEKESDVGYHLLSVCGRLSADMTTFMERRTCALEIRRRERGALLVSLQDIASKIWVGRCHVEMYGSCATQLDLPSSDLDVVICGLPHAKQHRKKKHGEMSEVLEHNPYHGYQSINGGRVLRLASELERQPWVVQIKPIPTASVPVIKMLADPARLGGIGLNSVNSVHDLGINSNGGWSIQSTGSPQAVSPQGILHQRTAQTMPHNFTPNSNDPSSSNRAHYMPILKPYPNPWRGADVLNGLMSIDITFEGPEHGGLGSTAYSTQVVRDACNESGLSPDATPAVQATMVLKELLAQRKLNEPFSGGLSSYALLLMVVAIMRERKAIRAEMDLAERQRKAVSAPALSVAPSIQAKSETDQLADSSSTLALAERNDAEILPNYGSEGVSSSNSSWASIAKQSNSRRLNAKEVDLHVPNVRAHIANDVNNGKTTVDSHAPRKLNIYDLDPDEHSSNSNNVQRTSHQCNEAPKSSSFNFSQGSNDVLEVLCSGEPTAGKLLMHFLLFYGHYFDAQTMSVDVTAEHGKGPFSQRRSGGSIDPITGMYTVDPIVVYDPLNNKAGSNVAKSCFAWSNIRCVFAQCYTTLQHTVERKGRRGVVGVEYGSGTSCLLELLLSF